MKTCLVSCIAVFATAISHAAPADDVSAAAKKLADSNYSWSQTVAEAGGGGGGGFGGFGGGPASGKTEKGGVTVITRNMGGNEMQIATKGDKTVIQNQDGAWVTTEEMMAQFGGGAGGPPGGAPGGGGGRGGRGGGMFGANVNPAEDILALVGQAKDFKAADGAIVGTLTPEGVAPRLGRGGFGRGGGGGGQAPAPANASGTVKFWLKDGVISKYEFHVKGTVQGRGGEQQVDRTTTVEIKDVGTTKIDLPAAAKTKLGS